MSWNVTEKERDRTQQERNSVLHLTSMGRFSEPPWPLALSLSCTSGTRSDLTGAKANLAHAAPGQCSMHCVETINQDFSFFFLLSFSACSEFSYLPGLKGQPGDKGDSAALLTVNLTTTVYLTANNHLRAFRLSLALWTLSYFSVRSELGKGTKCF